MPRFKYEPCSTLARQKNPAAEPQRNKKEDGERYFSQTHPPPSAKAVCKYLSLAGKPMHDKSGTGKKTSRYFNFWYNYYPTVKRRVKNHECFSRSDFSSLFISEDYSLAHSYTLQETQGQHQTDSFICVPLMSGLKYLHTSRQHIYFKKLYPCCLD